MSLIYEPRGRAREYSPLALNLTLGCSHGCTYCYNHPRFPNNKWRARKIDFVELERELIYNTYRDQVLLQFIGDPYCPEEATARMTERALGLLLGHCVPVAILTKGGERCLRDIHIYREHRNNIKVGATLTFADPAQSKIWEPGAALPTERLAVLRHLHDSGIKTWASIEPVIDPAQSLELIAGSLDFIDEFRVGRWNHDVRANDINWALFGRDVIDLFGGSGNILYLKNDLRSALRRSAIYIPPEYADMNRGVLHA